MTTSTISMEIKPVSMWEKPYLHMMYNFLCILHIQMFETNVMSKISIMALFSTTESTLMLLDYLSGRPLNKFLSDPWGSYHDGTHCYNAHTHKFTCNMTVSAHWASPEKYT